MPRRIALVPGSSQRGLYSIPEAMDHFGVSRYLINRWIDDGTLQTVTAGARDFITRASLDALTVTLYGVGPPLGSDACAAGP